MVHEFKPKVWMTCPLCSKQSPMPDPDRKEWVGLAEEDFVLVNQLCINPIQAAEFVDRILKEKNT